MMSLFLFALPLLLVLVSPALSYRSSSTTWSTDPQDMLERGIIAGMKPRIDTAGLDAALEGLRTGTIVLRDPNLHIKFPFEQTHAAELLWNSYARVFEDPNTPDEIERKVREMIFLLVEQGLNTGGPDYSTGKHDHVGHS